MYYLARRYDDSISQCQTGLEIDTAYVPARIQLALALEQRGMLPEAISELERARDQAAGYAITDNKIAKASLASSAETKIGLPAVHALLGHAYASAGRTADAQKELMILRNAARTRYVAPSWIAVVYIALGNRDEAFSWLQKSYQDRSEHMLYLKVEPLVDPLRKDLRFGALLQHVFVRESDAP